MGYVSKLDFLDMLEDVELPLVLLFVDMISPNFSEIFIRTYSPKRDIAHMSNQHTD